MKKKKTERIIASLTEMSTQAIKRSNLIAARLGINATDLECLEVLFRHGKATAGILASETGISTGAATKMLDRLEKAGFIERQPDKSDRRKIYIRLNTETVNEKVLPLYRSIGAATASLLEKYSAAELDLIADFLQKAIETSEADIALLKHPGRTE